MGSKGSPTPEQYRNHYECKQNLRIIRQGFSKAAYCMLNLSDNFPTDTYVMKLNFSKSLYHVTGRSVHHRQARVYLHQRKLGTLWPPTQDRHKQEMEEYLVLVR